MIDQPFRPRTLAALAITAALLSACAGTRAPKPAPPPPKPAKPAAPKPPAPAPTPERTVADVLATVGPEAEARLRAKFEAHGVDYPPKRAALLAFKEEKRLELWAEGDAGPKFIEMLHILGTSGDAGPKLHEGDYQVPEGVYRVIWLHPNSEYHLSLKLDYPNEFDRARAREDGRSNLGGDIFIHGSYVSVGCLAVGDRAVEDLFVLAARIGQENVEVLIAPWDLRHRPPPDKVEQPVAWLPQLYGQLTAELGRFR